ncbi:hypothetical protein [Limosilactobacillus sp.]|uniref:hypothetical protein n=1 Tax=Limosilactobacillus sp. TaxID=2773925 RepID=UPI003F07EABB
MSKKLFAGILLGGAATATAWTLLPAKKRQALREQLNDRVADWTDYATDYVLTALDIVDERLAEMDNSEVAASVKTATQKMKDKKDQVIDHLTNDDFDKQTAAIREKLAQAGSNEDTDDDIIIDATSDDQTTKTEK